jgi:long-chain fatty acid transport protein
MRAFLLGSVALLGAASMAEAGRLDRSGQSILAIFETGDYAELSFGVAKPDVQGTAIAPLGGFGSGDMAADTLSFGMAIKTELRDGLDIGLILDEPFGADVAYPTGTGYFAQGTTAEFNTQALTAVAKYRLPSNVSLLGGLRYQTMSAEATVPFVAGYSATTDSDGALGYVLGVAYEKPEIALRVALTYNSAIDHELDTIDGSLLGGGASVTEISSPQSLTLDFQSGVAKDTLVFGSVRWVDWSEFEIDPASYPPADPLVSYDDDTVTWTLGVGRRFNENWSAAVSLGYEKASGGFSANLGPSDGFKSIGIGATYTMDNVKITGGLRYLDLGDTDTSLNGVTTAATFRDNSAIAFGMKLGISF